MAGANVQSLAMKYGAAGRFSCALESDRIVQVHAAPPPNEQFTEDLAETLESPLDFPPLEQAVIPDDHVILALDRGTPEAATLIAAVWNILAKRDVNPDNVLILQPPCVGDGAPADPRATLPRSVRNRIGWKVHDAADETACTYLATSSGGERIYLAQEVVDADVVFSIGSLGYDPLLGYRGTNSVFFPGLSTEEAGGRTRGQGHRELRPDDDRPLRQMVDEIGWLLGTQFSLQVTPAAGGGVAHVIAGAMDSVFRAGKRLLARDWLIELESRPQMVVAAVDQDAAGHGWEQVGAALSAARNLVAQDGKIVILSELAAETREGLELLRESEAAADAIGPLRKLSPPDLMPATQLAGAASWAGVYLLSRLPGEVVEDLFMVPLESETEVQRLLGQAESCVFLPSAQHTFGQIGAV